MPTRRLFVSYSRLDREIVSRLCDLLRLGGTHVFRDEDDIKPGKRWQLMLSKAIQKAECVLVFWSTNSASSQAVRDEYIAAQSLSKDIAPVLLDSTPLDEVLKPYQWIDCRAFISVNPPTSLTRDGEASPEAVIAGSGALAQGSGSQASGTGGVAIGGNVAGNINTGGGAFVGGKVKIGGGDFVGRDKVHAAQALFLQDLAPAEIAILTERLVLRVIQ